MLRPPPSEENRRSFASETTVPTKHTEERRLRHVAATCTVEELDKWMGPKNTITMVPQWSPIIRLHLLSSFGLNIDLRIWFDFFRNNIATRQFYNGNAVPSYLRRMFPSTLRKLLVSERLKEPARLPSGTPSFTLTTFGTTFAIATYIGLARLDFSTENVRRVTFVFPLRKKSTHPCNTVIAQAKQKPPWEKESLWGVLILPKFKSCYASIFTMCSDSHDFWSFSKQCLLGKRELITTQYCAFGSDHNLVSEKQDLLLRKAQWRQLWQSSAFCRCLYRGHSPTVMTHKSQASGKLLSHPWWSMKCPPPEGFQVGKLVPFSNFQGYATEFEAPPCIIQVPMRYAHPPKKVLRRYKPRKIALQHMFKLAVPIDDIRSFQCHEGCLPLTPVDKVPPMPVPLETPKPSTTMGSHTTSFANDILKNTVEIIWQMSATGHWGPFHAQSLQRSFYTKSEKSANHTLARTSTHQLVAIGNSNHSVATGATGHLWFAKQTKKTQVKTVPVESQDSFGHATEQNEIIETPLGTVEKSVQLHDDVNVPPTSSETVRDNKGNVVYSRIGETVSKNTLLPPNTTIDAKNKIIAIQEGWSIGWKACHVFRRPRVSDSMWASVISSALFDHGLSINELLGIIVAYTGAPPLQFNPVPAKAQCPKHHSLTIYRDREFPDSYRESQAHGYFCDQCVTVHDGTHEWYHCDTCKEYDVCPDCIYRESGNRTNPNPAAVTAANATLAVATASATTAAASHPSPKDSPIQKDTKTPDPLDDGIIYQTHSEALARVEADRAKGMEKKAEWCIVKLALPPGARVNLPVGSEYFDARRKMRVDTAFVLDIQKPDPNAIISMVPEGVYDAISGVHMANRLIYTIGEWVAPDGFDTTTATCSKGIHYYEEHNRRAAFAAWIPDDKTAQFDDTNYLPTSTAVEAAASTNATLSATTASAVAASP